MSVTSPAPCAVIAARTSGALATRSTSFWACSDSSTCDHTCSAASDSSTRRTTAATSSLPCSKFVACSSTDALDRPDHRRTAQRADERLLDGLVERMVDARDLGDALGAAGAGGQQRVARGRSAPDRAG